MKSIIRFRLALWLLFFTFLSSPFSFAADTPDLSSDLSSDDLQNSPKSVTAAEAVIPTEEMLQTKLKSQGLFPEEPEPSSKKKPDRPEDGFTINFNNVSIIEFIKFAGKITNLNFIYDETELQFNVTITSEEPISTKNIMSILTQVLRIHDLNLLEQDNSILITLSKAIHQIPPIISGNVNEAKLPNIPIVTRVFRIKNNNLTSIAAIIRSMTSQAALIEMAQETRQLIVTDIAPNVEKIATLLASLDSPHSPLDIDSYTSNEVSSTEIVTLATKILTPFTEGNPFILVPQNDTNTTFIVSTPSLIERTLSVMQDLDVPSREVVTRFVTNDNIFIYKTINSSPEELKKALFNIAEELKLTPTPPVNLINTILTARIVKESSSLIFIGQPAEITKLQEILANVDGSQSFYIYSIKKAPASQIEASLKEFAVKLESSNAPDKALIDAIGSVKWIKETNSLVFTGKQIALSRLQEILPTFDTVTPQSQAASSNFWMYNPQNRPGEELEQEMRNVGANLKSSGLADIAFLNAIQSMKWLPLSNALLFTGDPQALKRVEDTIKGLDALRPLKGAFFLYKLENAQGSFVLSNLQKTASNLVMSGMISNTLAATVNDIKWVKETNSLLITGSPADIEAIKPMIAQFDVANGAMPNMKSVFFIYKPVNRDPQEIEHTLKDLASDLEASGLSDADLIQTIATERYVPATSSILFTGTPDSIEKLKNLLNRIDVPSGLASGIQQLSNATFLIYKVQYVSPEQFISAMKNFAMDLHNAEGSDKELVKSITNMKWLKETNSALFTGTEDTLKRIEALALKFDSSGAGVGALGPSSYFLYSPKNQSGPELISILSDFKQQLVRAGVQDPGLYQSIDALQWIDKTSSLLVSGTEESMSKIQQLLDRFDVPSRGAIEANIQSIDNMSFLVYKLQYHQGVEIQEALRQVATSLASTTKALEQGKVVDAQGMATSNNQALISAINSLQWIKVTNSLLVSGQQETLTKLKDLIQNLDVPLRQVFIEVLIIETTLANSQSFGLQWGGKIKYFNKGIGSMGNMPAPNQANPSNTVSTPVGNALDTVNPIAVPPVYPQVSNIPMANTNGFDLGMIGDIIMHKGKSFFSLGSLVNALQTDNDTTVVLNPKMITQDNNNSTIFIGQNIPFIGSSVTNQSQIQTINSNIEYRDVGVSLSITPLLGNGDIVTLDITNDISSVVENTQSSGNTNLTGLQTTHSSMNTRVHVPNNHFLVLSGMISDNKVHFKSSIPCLGGLPVIGAAFSDSDRSDSKDNIVFFVRPHIIDSFDEYKKLTADQEAMYKDQSVLPILKEQFDSAINMIKSPENE